MRRRLAAALALMLALSSGALAEDDHWTHNADLYYHINSGCGGMTGAAPISEKAALAFDKHACPVCIQEDAEGDVRAVVRGGTIVASFSDAWLAQQELAGVFGWTGETQYQGREGQQLLAEYLHGDAYNRFMQDYSANQAAEGRARVPVILAQDGELIMNSRHIGGRWYVVVRPAAAFDESWSMYWRVEGLALRMEGGDLYTNFDLQTVEERRELRLERASGAQPTHQSAAGDLGMTVYREMDANIAVIYQSAADGNRLQDVRLRIPGAEGQIRLSGYMEGDRGVYCCVLTDGELALLQGGAQPSLVRVEQITASVHRVAEADMLRYYSDESGELLFEIKTEGGIDPVADDFGLILGTGTPGRMVVERAGADVLMDYEGNIYPIEGTTASRAPGRITPLIWSGGEGVFLVESCHPGDFRVGERLWSAGLELGRRYAAQGYENWRCYLVDQDGRQIGGADNVAFTVYENGEIHLESAAGVTSVHQPFSAKD